MIPLISSPLNRLNDPLEWANGYRSMVPQSSATDASSPLLVLFRRSPRHAGTFRAGLTSKTMWTMKKPKLCGPKGSTLMTPRGHRGDRPCAMGTFARHLSHSHSTDGSPLVSNPSLVQR